MTFEEKITAAGFASNAEYAKFIEKDPATVWRWIKYDSADINRHQYLDLRIRVMGIAGDLL